MELKLQPVMTRLHPERDIARAREFAGIFDGKLGPVVRLFFRIGLWAYESGIVPRDPVALQALLAQRSDTQEEKVSSLKTCQGDKGLSEEPTLRQPRPTVRTNRSESEESARPITPFRFLFAMSLPQ